MVFGRARLLIAQIACFADTLGGPLLMDDAGRPVDWHGMIGEMDGALGAPSDAYAEALALAPAAEARYREAIENIHHILGADTVALRLEDIGSLCEEEAEWLEAAGAAHLSDRIAGIAAAAYNERTLDAVCRAMEE